MNRSLGLTILIALHSWMSFAKAEVSSAPNARPNTSGLYTHGSRHETQLPFRVPARPYELRRLSRELSYEGAEAFATLQRELPGATRYLVHDGMKYFASLSHRFKVHIATSHWNDPPMSVQLGRLKDAADRVDHHLSRSPVPDRVREEWDDVHQILDEIWYVVEGRYLYPY